MEINGQYLINPMSKNNNFDIFKISIQFSYKKQQNTYYLIIFVQNKFILLKNNGKIMRNNGI
jgi:hypothetical protein